jgi:hypothetical protein
VSIHPGPAFGSDICSTSNRNELAAAHSREKLSALARGAEVTGERELVNPVESCDIEHPEILMQTGRMRSQNQPFGGIHPQPSPVEEKSAAGVRRRMSSGCRS